MVSVEVVAPEEAAPAVDTSSVTASEETVADATTEAPTDADESASDQPTQRASNDPREIRRRQLEAGRAAQSSPTENS
jgi:hypothetical protein